MRKILISMIAVMIAASMTGCNHNDKPKDKKTNNSIASDTSNTKVKESKPTQEILDADNDSLKVQIADTVFTLPLTLEQLLNAGAVLEEDDINPINEIVDPGYGYTLNLSLNNKKICLTFRNYQFDNDDKYKRIQLKDCILYETYCFDGVTDDFVYNNDAMIFPKGIKNGSSIEDVKKIWGEPNSEEIDSMSYKTDNAYYTMAIDIEHQTVKDIAMYILDNYMLDYPNPKYEPTQEILDADMFSNKIQFGDKVIDLPITLDQLISETGATINNDLPDIAMPEDEKGSPTEIIDARGYKDLYLKIDNRSYKFTFRNTCEDEPKKLGECEMSSEINGYSTMIFPKGVKLYMSEEDVIHLWGEPNSTDNCYIREGEGKYEIQYDSSYGNSYYVTSIKYIYVKD